MVFYMYYCVVLFCISKQHLPIREINECCCVKLHFPLYEVLRQTKSENVTHDMTDFAHLPK